MKMRWLVYAAVASLAAGNACRAIDTVKTLKSTVPGRIAALSPVKVDLEQGASGVTKEIPVNQIQTIFFEDEPAELKTAKTHMLGGRYAEALMALERINRRRQPAGNSARHRLLQGILRRQNGAGGQRQDRRRGPDDESLRRHVPEELSLLRGLGARR